MSGNFFDDSEGGKVGSYDYALQVENGKLQEQEALALEHVFVHATHGGNNRNSNTRNSDRNYRWLCIGDVALSMSKTVASLHLKMPATVSRGLVFTDYPLKIGSPLQIKIKASNDRFPDCFSIGITDIYVPEYDLRLMYFFECINEIPANVWYITGNEKRHNSRLLQRLAPSLETLHANDRITLELMPGRKLRVLLNSGELYTEFEDIPEEVRVVVELHGSTAGVQIVSTSLMPELLDSEEQPFLFSHMHSENVRLLNGDRCAVRTQSFEKALVFVRKPLTRGKSITVKIDDVNPNWEGTIGLGVAAACQRFTWYPFPISILHLKGICWAATHDHININGNKMESTYGAALEHVVPGTLILMKLTYLGELLIMVNEEILGVLAKGLPNTVFPVFDIHGKCRKISILNDNDDGSSEISDAVVEAMDLYYERGDDMTNCEQDNDNNCRNKKEIC